MYVYVYIYAISNGDERHEMSLDSEGRKKIIPRKLFNVTRKRTILLIA